MGGFNTQQFNPDAAGTALGVPLSDLLKPALRKAGVTLAPGRFASPDQMAEAIGEINRMIGGWNCSPLLIFTKRIDLWPTIANRQSYTIGQDAGSPIPADWDGPRPQMITYANLLLPGNVPIRRKLAIWPDEQWRRIRYQKVNTYPEGLYNDGGAPFSTIYFYPIPDAAYQIELYTWQAISRFASVDDRVLLPFGYEDAIVNNGAVRLASMPWPNQRPMDPQVRADAIGSLQILQAYNASSPPLKTDGQLCGGNGTYNWMTGLMDA